MQASKYRLIGIVLVTSTLFAGLLTGCDGLTSSSKSAATPSNSASYVISESLAGTSHSSKAKGINENDKLFNSCVLNSMNSSRGMNYEECLASIMKIVRRGSA